MTGWNDIHIILSLVLSNCGKLQLLYYYGGVIIMGNANEIMSKQSVHRGEVYYIIPDGDALDGIMNGGRPGIIVSNDMNNQCNGLVEVVYLSRHPHSDVPTNVRIYSTGTKCWAICGQIQTVAKRRIGRFVNQVDDSEMENVNRAMALGLDAKLNLSTRDVQGHLDRWREEMRNRSDETVVSDARPFALDEPAVAVSVPQEQAEIKSAKNVDADTKQLEQPIVAAVSALPADINMHPDYIRVCAERDVYRNLYESLISGVFTAKSITVM